MKTAMMIHPQASLRARAHTCKQWTQPNLAYLNRTELLLLVDGRHNHASIHPFTHLRIIKSTNIIIDLEQLDKTSGEQSRSERNGNKTGRLLLIIIIIRKTRQDGKPGCDTLSRCFLVCVCVWRSKHRCLNFQLKLKHEHYCIESDNCVHLSSRFPIRWG